MSQEEIDLLLASAEEEGERALDDIEKEISSNVSSVNRVSIITKKYPKMIIRKKDGKFGYLIVNCVAEKVPLDEIHLYTHYFVKPFIGKRYITTFTQDHKYDRITLKHPKSQGISWSSVDSGTTIHL